MKSNFKKYIISGISAIILGALGSALWESFLRPAIYLLSGLAARICSYFYNESYHYISLGGNLFAIYLSRLGLAVLLTVLYLGPTNAAKSFRTTISKYKFARITILGALFFILASRLYYDETAERILRNIEIVAPYISDQEYKQLRSDFYSIDSKIDYDRLLESIEKIMDENDLL